MQPINKLSYLKNHSDSILPKNAEKFELVPPNSEVLFERSREYVFKEQNKDLVTVVNRLFATLLHLGCIGLAAPQVGINKRIVIFGMQHKHPKRLDEPPIPYTVLVNPKIIFFSTEQMIDYESCRSVPGKIAWITRSCFIKYQSYNINGELIQEEATGLKSRIIQHEVDHLDGVLITKRALKLEPMELYKTDLDLLNSIKGNLNKEFGYNIL